MSFFFNYPPSQHSFSFFFNDTATTEIYTLSLHDALPISLRAEWSSRGPPRTQRGWQDHHHQNDEIGRHTSELQSHLNLVCRLLLEKKKKTSNRHRGTR